MSSGIFLHVSWAWGSLDCLDLWVYTVHKLGIVSAIISSNIFQFPSPFIGNPKTRIWDCSKLSLIPLILFSFFQFCFLCVLFRIVYIAVSSSSIIFLSEISNLLSIPSTVFFIHIVLFIPRSLIWVFYLPLREPSWWHILWPHSSFQMSVAPPNILTITS